MTVYMAGDTVRYAGISRTLEGVFVAPGDIGIAQSTGYGEEGELIRVEFPEGIVNVITEDLKWVAGA